MLGIGLSAIVRLQSAGLEKFNTDENAHSEEIVQDNLWLPTCMRSAHDHDASPVLPADFQYDLD